MKKISTYPLILNIVVKYPNRYLSRLGPAPTNPRRNRGGDKSLMHYTGWSEIEKLKLPPSAG